MFLRTRPRPLHSRHGLSIVAPAPPQCGQVCWIEKKPWATRTCPTPPQVLQVIGCRARLGALARAALALDLGRNIERDGIAGDRLLERQLELVAQVRAAEHLAAAAAATAAEDVAEHVAEDVAERVAPPPKPPPPWPPCNPAWPNRS